MTRAGLRRIIHAGTALLILAGVLADWETFRYLLTAAVPLAGIIEWVRLTVEPARAWMARRVPVFRPEEAHRPSGAFWLVLGYAAAAWFPLPAAAAGFLSGALADPAGSLVGGRWGGGARKSWVGTGAVWLATTALTLALGVPMPTAAVTGGVAAALERWCGVLSDNLLVAPGVAVSVWLLA